MHYKLARTTTAASLEAEVQRHLTVGWLPVGGLCVRVYTDACGDQAALYLQALFHPEVETPSLPALTNEEFAANVKTTLTFCEHR